MAVESRHVQLGSVPFRCVELWQSSRVESGSVEFSSVALWQSGQVVSSHVVSRCVLAVSSRLVLSG